MYNNNNNHNNNTGNIAPLSDNGNFAPERSWFSFLLNFTSFFGKKNFLFFSYHIYLSCCECILHIVA